MKGISIIDIRKYTGSKSEIVNGEGNEIIFTKEIQVNNKYYLSIYCYNAETDTIEEIHKYEIPRDEYTSQYFRVDGEDIIIIKMHLENRVEAEIINRHTKEIKSKHCFKVKEIVNSIPIIINSSYFMFFADIDDMNTNEYNVYKEKGYEHFIYLGDLIENKSYLIKDMRIVDGVSVVHGLLGYIPTFIHNEQEYLIFNETYMDDYEHEEIYNEIQANKLDKDGFNPPIDALYLISVRDLVESIELGKQNIPFEVISKKCLNGWVRYMSIDEENIYFREKDFETQNEKIYKLNKLNLKSAVLKEIDHEEIKGRIFYNDKIYEKTEENDYINIRGLYNCDYKLNFKNDKNIWFNRFIDDRYLITTQCIEDEEDDYFEFVYITDTKENKCIKYDGSCKIYNNQIILYDNSGYF